MGVVPADLRGERGTLKGMRVPSAQEADTADTPPPAFVQRFSSTRRGARLARRLAAHKLDAWGFPYGSEVSDDVVLVVAELSSNAVLHGCVPGRDFELRLTCDRAAGTLRVEVSDTHPARPEEPEPPAPGTAEHGRGLLVVASLAARWGVRERTGPGKTAWAELTYRQE